MIFPWNNNANSKDHAKSRLKLIIAHDRASINSDMLTAMREEILDVVARYVEVDREEMEFSLSNDPANDFSDGESSYSPNKTFG